MNNLEKKIAELQKKNEELEMVASCAKDIVDSWPMLTFRTMRPMCSKVDVLKEALNLLDER